MNGGNFDLAEGLVSSRYIKQAAAARRKRENLVTTLLSLQPASLGLTAACNQFMSKLFGMQSVSMQLTGCSPDSLCFFLSQRRLPKEGWDDDQIELLMRDLAAMDSNNFVDNVGVGEREGRVYSRLVRDRYQGMMHGVGRSGDLTAEQPKAAGSSLMAKLTNILALQALKLGGLSTASNCAVLPVATGMAITLSLLAIMARRPGPKKVLWPRVDQKTCLKSLLALGLEPIIIENKLQGDEVVADEASLLAAIETHKPSSILAVVVTTSCFAPRVPEKVVPIAEACKAAEVPLLVNNAYGCQTKEVMAGIASAGRRGRVDGVIQSTDKNFMVPVGGAILATVGGQDDLLAKVAALYPGRASSSPTMDLFITLLSMGEQGYQRLLQQREELFPRLLAAVGQVAQKHGERMLDTKNNRISMAMSLGHLLGADKGAASQLGGMLFARCCSGTRVVTCVKTETVGGISFKGYGAHIDDYPQPYLSFACAIGITAEEIDTFAQRLDKALGEVKKRLRSSQETSPSAKSTPPPPPSQEAEDGNDEDEADLVPDPPVQENPPAAASLPP